MELFERSYTQAERDLAAALLSRSSIARAVIDYRITRGWSQESLAQSAGTKQSRISEIECLRGNPRLDTLDKVATALGLYLTMLPRSQYRESFRTEFPATATGSTSRGRFEGTTSATGVNEQLAPAA
jgi:ribosome-binding protein aMBF1 (putative translation factor)